MNPFSGCSIVSCGTLRPELTYLQDSGFLQPDLLTFTRPGLHEDSKELERQLRKRIERAKEQSDRIIVVYGDLCFMDNSHPDRTVDDILHEEGENIIRIDAHHCVDMLASEKERKEMAQGEKIWWMTPGWMLYRQQVFLDWDKGKAVETFPKHTGGARVLDGIDFFEKYSMEHPEELLDYSDWMGVPIDRQKISLDRFKGLLLDQADGRG